MHTMMITAATITTTVWNVSKREWRNKFEREENKKIHGKTRIELKVAESVWDKNTQTGGSSSQVGNTWQLE